MLIFIGLGLGDEQDLTLYALETLKKCDFIYLENYTSLIGFKVEVLEKLLSKKIKLADRELVESSNEIITHAQNHRVAFLIKGDVFSATTHIDLFLRAKKEDIKCKIIHNASILTAVGDTGLSLYKFGKVASLPFNFTDIRTPLDIYIINKNNNMHTLFLLDLDPQEGKYMDFKMAFDYLLNKGNLPLTTLAVVCAGLGTSDEVIKYGTIKDLLSLEIHVYPQCIILPSELHFMEEEFIVLHQL